jgi:hypothetical protein
MSAEITAPALLSIGINSGGMSPQNHLVHEALGAFQRMVVREREGFPNDGLRVNIVFHVPGPMFQPDYEGVHASRLDRKNGHLLIVAAVPAELTYDQVSAYEAEVLRTAAREAREYVVKRKVPLKLDHVQALMDHLVAELEATANG